jgi:hypothetical protein
MCLEEFYPVPRDGCSATKPASLFEFAAWFERLGSIAVLKKSDVKSLMEAKGDSKSRSMPRPDIPRVKAV